MDKAATVVTEQTMEKVTLLELVSSNKSYLYILLVVIVLGAIGYYLYTKQFAKKSEEKPKELPSIEEPMEKKNILDPKNEYYLIDPEGKPVSVNQYFTNILQSNQQQNVRPPIMINNQIPIPMPPAQEVRQTVASRPKLTHPSEQNVQQRENQTQMTDEDENVANQDLTMEEIEELKRQLDMIQRKQNAPVTAQNDEEGDNEQF